MTFLDTNYFLRFLLKDIPEQYEAAKNLFLAGLEGRVSLITSSIVFFEIFWVLRSYYKLDKKEAIPTLRRTLKLSFIELPERDILNDALLLFEKTNLLDLEDCYNFYFAKSRGVSAGSFKTFDKKLEKLFNL